MKKITLLILLITTGSVIGLVSAQNHRLKITVGNSEFTATLNNNETVNTFISMLPLEVNMNEMGGYEKFYNLPQNLPGSASNVGTTNEGDLMIWSSNCLVLFYVTRSTSYSYIRLGRIDNTSGLSQALGSGNVQVKFELEGNETSNEIVLQDEHRFRIHTYTDHLEVSGDVNQLTLYTMTGTMAGKSNNNSISTTSLNPGIYLLRIDAGVTGTITEKIIIK